MSNTCTVKEIPSTFLLIIGAKSPAASEWRVAHRQFVWHIRLHWVDKHANITSLATSRRWKTRIWLIHMCVLWLRIKATENCLVVCLYRLFIIDDISCWNKYSENSNSRALGEFEIYHDLIELQDRKKCSRMRWRDFVNDFVKVVSTEAACQQLDVGWWVVYFEI